MYIISVIQGSEERNFRFGDNIASGKVRAQQWGVYH